MFLLMPEQFSVALQNATIIMCINWFQMTVGIVICLFGVL